MKFRFRTVPRFNRDLNRIRKNEPQLLRKVEELIRETLKNPFGGIGSPHAYARFEKCWARRINSKHLLVYVVDGGIVKFMSCHGHYDDH
jgi:toxin YoeB